MTLLLHSSLQEGFSLRIRYNPQVPKIIRVVIERVFKGILAFKWLENSSSNHILPSISEASKFSEYLMTELLVKCAYLGYLYFRRGLKGNLPIR